MASNGSKWGDYSKVLLARVVLYALCQKKTENNFLKTTFLRLTPATRVLKIEEKTIISQKIKIVILGCLIAQMKHFYALITT